MQRLWETASPRHPCPICGKRDWCAVSADGAWALCRRVDTGAIHKTDKSGADYWLYRLDGHAPCRQPLAPLPALPHVERADPSTLDQVYRALLAALPLSAAHRQALRQRGLRDAEILRRGYRTLALEGRAALARRLVARCGADTCATVPGFYLAERDGRRWWSLAGATGLLIPVRNVDGRIVALKARADAPGEGPRYTYLSSTHHSGPGPGAPVHVPLHAITPGAPVRLTEGELKADVATVLSNVLTLSVPGVALWPLALDTLRRLSPTCVLVSFDSDWRTNHHVGRALSAAAFALARAGYTIQTEDWHDHPEHKGIDDLLAAGHTPTLHGSALAFGAAWRSQARVWTGTIATRDAAEVHPWH